MRSRRRRGACVALIEVAIDGGLQADDEVEAAAPDALRVSAEKNVSTAFNQSRRRREVEGPARMARQPSLHLGMLVCGVVVDDGLNHLPGGHLSLNHVEEADELGVPMTLHASADHRAFQHIQRREQRGGAVALVVVCHRAAAAGFQRQPRLSAIQRLDWLFSSIDSTTVWPATEVEADDIGHFLGKALIARALELRTRCGCS